jgi:isopentenyl-diphosphate delta-isomerase
MEYIVFVDEDGQPTGETGEKLASHHDATKLHLAFSCYIFNKDDKVLVTRRADSKKVWPTVWTNSVCGHPAPGESFEGAIKRRAQYELGLEVSDIEVKLPKYRYQTSPYNGIIENEFCPVFFAKTVAEPIPNPEEVSAYEWLEWDGFINKTESDTADVWSWWCKDQLKQLKKIAEIA